MVGNGCHGIFKSKINSCFPNSDALNALEIGHNSLWDFFLLEELLLDITAWIDLTSDTDTSIVLDFANIRAHFGSLTN